jgi:hypothetical protein
MIAHFLLFSRYVGNRGPNLRSRDFKLTTKCVLSSDSFLLTTARKSKGSHLNYFFIHKLKPKYSSISKTVKIKGCECPAYKFPSSYYREYLNVAAGQILLPKISRRSNDCFFNRTSTQRRLRHSRK